MFTNVDGKKRRKKKAKSEKKKSITYFSVIGISDVLC
jgi:hypothetical protein